MLTCCRMSLLAAALIVAPVAAQDHAGPEEISFPGVGKEEHFLASGPMPVVLTRYVTGLEKTTKVEASLLLLKQEGIIYRERDRSGALKSAVREAPNRYDPILSIHATVGEEKLTWTLDKKKKLYTGPVLPVPRIKIASAPFSKDEESKYLVFACQQMLDTLDSALQVNDPRAVKQTLEKAERLARHAENNGLSAEVVALLRKLKAHHEELDKIAADQAQAFKKVLENDKRFAAERGALEARNAPRLNVGAAGFFLGFLADDPRLAADGYVSMTQAAQRHLAQVADLELAKSFADEAVLAELKKLALRREAAWIGRDKFVKDVERKLKLPERESIRDFAKEMQKSKDRSSAVRKLNVLATLYRQATPRGNPWLQEEIYYNESLIPYAATQKQQVIEKWFELAEKTRGEVANIPPSPIYDTDRTVMLWRAARLAVRAAMLDVGEERSLRDVYSEHAVYALRLLDVSKKYNVIDIGAGTRELEVFAMALADMHEEALELGSRISETRAKSPILHFYMAKLYAASSADKRETIPASRAALAKAVKAGFSDVSAAKKNADLKKVIDAKFTYEHLTPILHVKVITPKSGFGKCDLQVTNASPFPVNDVQLLWLMPTPFMGLRPADQFRIEALAPGQTKIWEQTKVQYNRFNSAASLGSIVTPRKDLRLEKIN